MYKYFMLITFSLCVCSNFSTKITGALIIFMPSHLANHPLLNSESGSSHCTFKDTMDSIVKHWLPHNPYHVVLLRAKVWTLAEVSVLRRSWQSLDIKFLDISNIFHQTLGESHGTENKKKNIGFKRLSTYFWAGISKTPFLAQYKYLLRLDTWSCLEDPINYDIFQEMKMLNIVYSYHSLFLDDAEVTIGLTEFAEQYMKKNSLAWSNEKVRDKARALTTSSGGKSPAFSTSLEVIDMERYRKPDVMHFVQAVVNSGNIFSLRWGDAPLKFMLAQMFFGENEVFKICEFRYHRMHKMCEARNSDNPILNDISLLN